MTDWTACRSFFCLKHYPSTALELLPNPPKKRVVSETGRDCPEKKQLTQRHVCHIDNCFAQLFPLSKPMCTISGQ